MLSLLHFAFFGCLYCLCLPAGTSKAMYLVVFILTAFLLDQRTCVMLVRSCIDPAANANAVLTAVNFTGAVHGCSMYTMQAACQAVFASAAFTALAATVLSANFPDQCKFQLQQSDALIRW